MRELSDGEISGYLKKYKNFGGVNNKSSLKSLDSKVYVENIDKVDGPGTHWVMTSNINPLYCFYFDSFGEVSPAHIELMMKATGKRCLRNMMQIQELSSDSCGWFCMLVSEELLLGKSPQDILRMFGPKLSENEKVLQTYFNSKKDRIHS
jgi:hypothetical protein